MPPVIPFPPIPWVGHAVLPTPPDAQEPLGVELHAVSWVPFIQWSLTNVIPGQSAADRLGCNAGLAKLNPWVSAATGRVLVRASDGTYYLTFTNCTTGDTRSLWPLWALDGTPAGDRAPGLLVPVRGQEHGAGRDRVQRSCHLKVLACGVPTPSIRSST